MSHTLSAPDHARFVWLKDCPPSRNLFVRFQRRFILASPVAEPFWLHLFADTRYRLWVNSQVVAAGPARFVTTHPEYDSHDLAPFLRPGENLLEVEVNYFGASSYQSMPDGKPGFIAWGGDAENDLATPGDWSGNLLTAWRADAPLFSFAQNPVEICDTRFISTGESRPLIILHGENCPWQRPTAYSGRPIRRDFQAPRCIEAAGPLANGEKLYGFMGHNPGYLNTSRAPEQPYVGFATWVLSPCAQTVRFSCFWSDLFCNGVPLAVDTETPFGNHGYAKADLVAGWNLLTGKVQLLTEFWAWCFGVPCQAGLSLHACRDLSCPDVFALSKADLPGDIQLPEPDADRAPEGWLTSDGDATLLTPARVMGWDRIAPNVHRDIPLTRLPEFSTFHAPAATWCFSFQGEFYGYLDLEVEAPSGSILDVGYDDWQSADGGIALYRSNPFTDAADRFILAGGRQRIQGFHPRGGKLLQVTLRSPDGQPASLSLHRAGFQSRRTFPADETHFSCDQPALTWSWPTALRTLVVSSDESFTDCPWRERGCYIGDSWVSLHLEHLLQGDLHTARRVLRLFAQASLPDGQLPCCAPSWLRKPHEDFSLIWILAVRDYWQLSGDRELLRELWPTVQRLLDPNCFVQDETGLWDSTGRRLFIDWGVLPSEREGAANAVMNLLRYGALQAAGSIAGALEDPVSRERLLSEAERVSSAIREALWQDSCGTLRASKESETAALHANVLALFLRWGTEAERQRILEEIEPRLRRNFRQGLTAGQFSGHLELYFLNFVLPALAEHGRPDLAEALIAEHYGYLQSLGDDTLPECFCRVEVGIGSRCHAWSGAAAIYAARYVLGLRPGPAGDPNVWIWEPKVHGIRQAAGRVAHPRGWIEVDWKNIHGTLEVELTAPEGVTILRTGAARHFA